MTEQISQPFFTAAKTGVEGDLSGTGTMIVQSRLAGVRVGRALDTPGGTRPPSEGLGLLHEGQPCAHTGFAPFWKGLSGKCGCRSVTT